MSATAGGAKTRVQHIGTQPDGRDVLRLVFDVQPHDATDGSRWIQICPMGPFVESRDGRTFQISDALSVVASTELPLLLDWEHRSEWGDSKAAGWVEELKVQMSDAGDFPRAGFWGRVDYTPQGKEDTDAKVYRFTSPVVILDGETRDVQFFASVALTNRPALHMAGIDQMFSARLGQQQKPIPGDKPMLKPETAKLLFAVLGLAEGATTDEQFVEAFNARIAAQKPAAGAITAEQFTALSNQVNVLTSENTSLKAKIADGEKASFALEVKTALDAATEAGKIVPASRAVYEQICSTREGFNTFKAMEPNLAVIGEPAPRSPKGRTRESRSAGGNASAESYRARLKSQGFTDAQIAAADNMPTAYGKQDADDDDGED